MQQQQINQIDYEYNDFSTKPDPPHQPMYLDKIISTISSLGDGAKVLDAGCGDGNFAQNVSQFGYDVFGIDLSDSGIKIAKERGCGNFHYGSLYDPLCSPFGIEYFDCIYSVEVIEHLYSPKIFSERLFSAVKPGGLVIITTPYWGYLKNVVLSVSGRMDNSLTALWEGGHIKHFSRKTLSSLFKGSGFEEVSFRGAGAGLRAYTPWLWNGMVMVFKRPL
jgi:2-polyprenyl-3-methyl-5-hydroxy-6-metoxy-1,4-benzoquinol methylase